MPLTAHVTIATARVSANEFVISSPLLDQLSQIEHRPSMTVGTVGGKLVPVLMKGAECVQADHRPDIRASPIRFHQ